MTTSSKTRAEYTAARRDLTLGSHQLEIRKRGTGPAGPAHLVGRDRRTVCEGEVVRFTFPGRPLSSEHDICDRCNAATRRLAG